MVKKKFKNIKSNKKILLISILSFIFLSLLVIAVTNQFYPQYSDQFDNFALDTTKWITSTYKSPDAITYALCTSSFNEASQPYYTETGSCSKGSVSRNAIVNQWTCLNYSFGVGYDAGGNSSFNYWDIYFRMNATLNADATPSFTSSGSGSANIFVSNLSNASSTQTSNLLLQTYSVTNNDGTFINLPDNIYRIRITDLPGLQTAAIYVNGVYNRTEGLSTFHNWYLCWYAGASASGTYTASGSSTVRAFNFSTFLTDVDYVDYGSTYLNDTPETSNNNYYNEFLTSTDNADNTVSAKFTYNGVEYPATISDINPITYTFNVSANIDVPQVNVDTDFDFYWTITLSKSGVLFTQTSDTYTQTVNDTTLALCDGSNGLPYLNITTYELGSFIEINSSLALAGTYYLGSGTTYEDFAFNDVNANMSRFNFCFVPSNYPITFDGYAIAYYTDPISNETYPDTQYWIDSGVYSNDTELLPLYLYTDNSSEIVTFSIVDQNYNAVQNAYVRVLYWNPIADNFYTVGITKTDVLGETQQWIKRFTTFYKYQVLYDGHLYLETAPAIETELERTLQINLGTTNPYDQLGNVSYSFFYNNNTQVFQFEWADSSGLVQTGCLRVTTLGNTSVLSLQCLSSASGVLTYDLTSDGNGTYVGQAILVDTDGISSILKTLVVTIGTPSRFGKIGFNGIIPAIVLIGTLFAIGIAAGSLPYALLLGVIGIGISFAFGLANFAWGVLISLIAIALIILIFSRRRSG